MFTYTKQDVAAAQDADRKIRRCQERGCPGPRWCKQSLHVLPGFYRQVLAAEAEREEHWRREKALARVCKLPF